MALPQPGCPHRHDVARIQQLGDVELRGFEVGVVPAGGEERVPWRKPEPGQALVAQIQTASGVDFTEDFSLAELDGGKVRYHLKTLTRDEFGKEAPCAVK